ncbi:cytochrome c oxidase subunit 7B [Ptiloglossa arizonensis]|uniref:cytochrome c oxidase subunit 7B n=1 Tax=Ptiloglossa arizonensis TaxID=3350558 RepID=UPI003FA08B60
MFRHLLKPVLQSTRIGTRSYKVPHDVRPPHMDEIVVPSGSWKELHDKNQRRYNLTLIAGVVVLLVTIAVGRSNGTLWLNYSPPTPPTPSK